MKTYYDFTQGRRYTVYTNDLSQHPPNGKLVMYADDVQFLDTDLPGNLPELKRRIDDNLAVALRWFTKNRLKVNPTKTDLLVLKRRTFAFHDASLFHDAFCQKCTIVAYYLPVWTT